MLTVILFSHLRWSFVYQRPQHLMSELARHYRVVYIEEPVVGDGPARIACRTQGPNLQVLQPCTAVQAEGFHDDQLTVLRPLIEGWLHDEGIDDFLAWFHTPLALPLISRLHPRLVVYDCMDPFSADRSAPPQVSRREAALLGVADLVLTGGPALYEAMRALHPNVHYLPSAVDAEHFVPREAVDGDPEAAVAARLMAAVPRPRLGFFGVIDERLDLGLIDGLAVARPDWHVAMVGPVSECQASRLPQRPNIHWFGPQPYARLPHLMAHWDLCLMPYAINEATRWISPTKTLEYMAGEKPVVSTAVSDVVSLYGDLVRIARDPGEFIDACAASLAETPRQRNERLVRMVAAVYHTSWAKHGRAVHRLLCDQLARQRVPLGALAH